ncbi:MAG TPA: hypothetical protein VGO92_11145 [Acidimicrobiales bacterium]|jgi:hypothetical protein|nr:hypothetical protein [Acidimicrobiales bacterium]
MSTAAHQQSRGHEQGRLGFWPWVALLCGPILWMVHITGVSAFASGACERSGYRWWAHGLTVATGVPVAAAIAVSARLVRRARSDVVRFLAWFGLFVGGLSLLLILLEELYIWAVRVCGFS